MVVLLATPSTEEIDIPKPNRYQKYSHYDILERMGNVDEQLKSIQGKLSKQQDMTIGHYLVSIGVSLAALSIAGVALSESNTQYDIGLSSAIAALASLAIVALGILWPLKNKRSGS